MPDYYPVYLNLAGKRCVIFGGGGIAQGKIGGLLRAGCQITVISPDATPGIRQAAQRGDIEWQQRPYRHGDLAGAFIGVAATNVWHVNQEICQEAEGCGVLLNVVDDPDLCTFIAPSVVKREPVTLAISTGGASPALARKLRETLAQSEALEWADLADTLAQARRIIKEKRIAIDPERWQCCITRKLLEMAQEGRADQALEKLLSQLLDASTPGMCANLAQCQPRSCPAHNGAEANRTDNSKVSHVGPNGPANDTNDEQADAPTGKAQPAGNAAPDSALEAAPEKESVR